jgi:hypothetical protein
MKNTKTKINNNNVICYREYKNEFDFLEDIEYTKEEWKSYLKKHGSMIKWSNTQFMNFMNEFLPIITKKYQQDHKRLVL